MSTTNADVRRVTGQGPQEGLKYERPPASPQGPPPAGYNVSQLLAVHLPALSVLKQDGGLKVQINDLGPCEQLEIQVGALRLTLLCGQKEGERIAKLLAAALQGAKTSIHPNSRAAHYAKRREEAGRREKP